MFALVLSLLPFFIHEKLLCGNSNGMCSVWCVYVLCSRVFSGGGVCVYTLCQIQVWKLVKYNFMDQKLFNSVVSFMIIAWNMNDEMNCIWLVFGGCGRCVYVCWLWERVLYHFRAYACKYISSHRLRIESTEKLHRFICLPRFPFNSIVHINYSRHRIKFSSSSLSSFLRSVR